MFYSWASFTYREEADKKTAKLQYALVWCEIPNLISSLHPPCQYHTAKDDDDDDDICINSVLEGLSS